MNFTSCHCTIEKKLCRIYLDTVKQVLDKLYSCVKTIIEKKLRDDDDTSTILS